MVCPRPLTEAVLVNIQPIHQVKRCPHPAKVKREKPSLFKMKKRGTQRVTLHYLLLLHVLCYVSTSQGQIFSKISTAKHPASFAHTDGGRRPRSSMPLWEGNASTQHGSTMCQRKPSQAKDESKSIFPDFFFPNGCLRM